MMTVSGRSMRREPAAPGRPIRGRDLNDQYNGAIDCDIHPRVPTPRALARHMDDHWRDTVELRGIETWDSISYPPNAPLTSRPEWRKAGVDMEPAKTSKETLDRFGFAHAICNSL